MKFISFVSEWLTNGRLCDLKQVEKLPWNLLYFQNPAISPQCFDQPRGTSSSKLPQAVIVASRKLNKDLPVWSFCCAPRIDPSIPSRPAKDTKRRRDEEARTICSLNTQQKKGKKPPRPRTGICWIMFPAHTHVLQGFFEREIVFFFLSQFWNLIPSGV